MRRGLASWLGALAVAVGFAAHAQEKILVQDPAIYEPDSPIAEADRLECNVAHRLSRAVLDTLKVARPADAILDASRSGSDWGLRLVIVNLNGVGKDKPQRGLKYGHWSVRTRAELYRDAKLAASLTLQRATVMGQGTCPITDKIVKALGKDLSKWLDAEIRSAESSNKK